MNSLISNQKSLFHIPNHVTYLNASYMGPMLNKSVEMASFGNQIKQQPWTCTMDHFFGAVTRAKNLFAELSHTKPENIAIVPSATYGITSACQNIKLTSGQKILVQEGEFPAIYYPLKKLAVLNQAELVIVPRPENGDWTSAILNSIDSKTAVIAVSPVHWMDGAILDVQKIGQICLERNLIFLVDACQSMGARPLNIDQCHIDYLVAPTYKWMLGAYGITFMYVHPRHQQGQPLEEYWASKIGAEDFSKLCDYTDEYAQGATRFDMGEKSNMHTLPIVISALEQILLWQVPRIESYIGSLTDQLSEIATKKKYEVVPSEFRSRHIIGIRKPGGFSSSFCDQLKSHNIHVSLRGVCLRVSPHLYNSPEDIQKLADFL